MTDSEWEEVVRRTVASISAISSSKGREYTQDSNDRLANFKRAGSRTRLHPMTLLFVYLDKHMNSITTYVNDTAAGDRRRLSEPIEGRIDDAIMYLLLLKGLIADGEKT